MLVEIKMDGRKILATAAVALLLAVPASAERLKRSTSEVLAFKRHTPCPSTGERRGACPGYAVDHVRPLCAGGEDRRGNMQWITTDDHRFKTLVDARECRKLRKLANRPAA